MKKALATLIALVLVFAMVGTAFADQTHYITIDNAKDGETYTAYKIFDVTYSGTNSNPGTDPGAPAADPTQLHTAYAYTITNNPSAADWFDFLTAGLTADAEDAYTNPTYGLKFTPTAADPNTYLVQPLEINGYDSTKAAALAAAIRAEIDRAETAATATPPTANPYTVAGTGTGASGSATINVSPDVEGYYFVTTTTGSLCSLDTTEPTATIREKNTTSSATKQVKEDKLANGEYYYGDKNDAEYGETVNYKTTVVIGAHQYNVVLHDVLATDKLAIDWSSITVGAPGTSYATIYTPAADTGHDDLPAGSTDTFMIAFDNDWTEGLTTNTTVVITYNAVVTTSAVLDEQSGVALGSGNDNKTWLKFGDAQESTPDWTRTYVWSFPIFKYTEGDTQYAAQSTYATAAEAEAAGFTQNTADDATSDTYWMKTPKNPLADAHFSLYRAADTTTPMQFVQVSSGANDPTVYRLATAADIADGTVTKVTDLVTPASGLITIQGLDSEQYVLRETAAPDGYNKLASDIAVEISAITSNGVQGNTITGQYATDATKTLKENNETVNQVEVKNNTGNELPATGGIGTTIFYVLGGLLVVGAIVVLFVRKRMTEQA